MLPNKRHRVYCFFDYISPFAYLTWLKFKKGYKGEEEWPKALYATEWVPIMLGSLFSHWQTQGPGQIPPKRLYLFRESFRRAMEWGVPFETPPRLPFNSLYALCCSLDSKEQQNFSVIDRLFHASWGEGKDLESIDVISQLLRESPEYRESNLNDPKEKQKRKTLLRENVSMAINMGVFGVPTFVVVSDTTDGQDKKQKVFWGLDSWDHLLSHLRGKDHHLFGERYCRLLAKHL